MALPPELNLEPAQPASGTRAVVHADIAPRVARSHVYTGGTATGQVMTYTLLSDFVWWYAVSAFERMRGSTDINTGSLLETSQALAQDAGIDMAHSLVVTYDPQEQQMFQELARDFGIGADLLVWPRPTQNSEYIHTAEGVTMLTLMANSYPLPFYKDFGEAGASPNEVLEELFAAWEDSGLFPWWRFAPVPVLQTLTPDLLPPDKYQPGDGLVPVRGVILPQTRENRRSMLQIVEDLLSPFPGTTFKESVDGEFEIVPAYGMGADFEPVVDIRPNYLINLSEGMADPFSVINRATVESSSISHVSGEPVMQPAYLQIGADQARGVGWPWFEPPEDRLNLQPAPKVPRQEFQPNATQWPDVWPLAENALPSNSEGIQLIDEHGNSMLSTSYMHWRAGNLLYSGTDGLQWETYPGSRIWRFHGAAGAPSKAVIPWNGSKLSFRVRRPGEPNLFMEASARWTGNGVQISPEPSVLRYVPINMVHLFTAEVLLNDATGAVKDTGSSVSGTFGIISEGDYIPGVGQENALAQSQQKYGIRETTIRIRGYDLQDPVLLKEIAKGIVLRGIQPKVVRRADMTILGSTRVRNEHVGRVVRLPTGEEGYLVSRQYIDDFTPPGIFSASIGVEVADPRGAGAIDPGGRSQARFIGGDVWMLVDGEPFEWIKD